MGVLEIGDLSRLETLAYILYLKIETLRYLD